MLQPLPDNTPLAALFNEWLRALAPVERLTCAKRQSAIRTCLQEVTNGLHFYHRVLVTTLALIEKGWPPTGLEKYYGVPCGKPSLVKPIVFVLEGLALAVRGPSLRTPSEATAILGCTYAHLRKLIKQPAAFTERAARIEQLLDEGQQIALDIEFADSTSQEKLMARIHRVLAANR